MKFTAHTKISELIKADKNCINALAAISKPLEKLKNPVLRKLMASRVTVAEAAQMGNSNIAEFERVLKPLGFYFETDNKGEMQEVTEKPQWLQELKPEKNIRFDVRQMLSKNNDPLKEIMKKFKALEVGSSLCIINTFIPTPLIKLFEKKNTLSYTEKISDKEYRTYFLKQENKKAETISQKGNNIFTGNENELPVLRQKFEERGIVEIDVRHLEMPEPMQRILAALEKLSAGQALFVHHKRVPLYLLEELESKNFIIHIFNISESEVKLLIEKGD